jgi:hypothetical protein
MADDLDDLDEASGDPQPRKAAGWSSSTSGTRPSHRDPGCSPGVVFSRLRVVAEPN